MDFREQFEQEMRMHYPGFDQSKCFADHYIIYLENRLKDAEEKVKQLIIYAKTL